MIEYLFKCGHCKKVFSDFCYISDYTGRATCTKCNNISEERVYTVPNISVIKGDAELNTLGDLADRNRDRMSEDEKANLFIKNNAYKYNEPEKELPKGMSRQKKKGEKIIWPGTKPKQLRKPQKKQTQKKQ